MKFTDLINQSHYVQFYIDSNQVSITLPNEDQVKEALLGVADLMDDDVDFEMDGNTLILGG